MSQEDSQDQTHIHTVLSKDTQVAHYRIIKKIGAGGMGEVYLADDTNLDRKIALKFLPASLISNNELKARFSREAKAVAKLNHPNIITIYEVGEFQERPYFAMEYIDGKTLANHLDDSSSLSQAVELALQICQGLAEAHRMGIIHRDIKSANIVVDEQDRLRILDFGLASVAGSEELTKVGSTLGTVSYMSPEQVSGRPIDKRSDLFSFGVVLYELLTGKLPFKRDNDGTTLQAIMQESPEPLHRYKSDLPDQLQQIVSKLLEKNIEIRYQSAEGVIADLKRLLYDSQQTTGSVSLEKVDDKSIVVIPFSNLSADADNEYFSDGLTEEIITDLSGISDLRVISRSSALLLKGTKKDSPTIGKELNVRYILTGSVRKAGNNVRITSQLVDAVINQQVWADKYKGTLEDIFEIQEEVSKAIVSNLQLKLTTAEEKKMTEHLIEIPEVFELFLRAKQEIYVWEEENLYTAEKYLLKGLEIEGDNALLLAGLAHVYFQFVNIGSGHDLYYQKAHEYVKKSLSLNPNLAQAHLVQGLLTQASDGNQLEGVKHYKKVLEIEPTNIEAFVWSAIDCGLVGQIEKAREFINKALTLSPIAKEIKSASGFVELMGGNYDGFFKKIEKIFNYSKGDGFALCHYVFAHVVTGKLDQVEKLSSKFTRTGFFERLTLSFYYGKIKEYDKGKSYLSEETLTTAWRDGQYSLFFAMAYAALNEFDTSIDWLENAFEKGFLNYKFITEYEQLFEPIRKTERFIKLVENMKQKKSEIDS